MANKSNRWFRSAGHRPTAGRNIRHRRLNLERIEDRLLLTGDFVGGMERFTLSVENSNYLVVACDFTPGSAVLCNQGTTESALNDKNNGHLVVITASDTGNLIPQEFHPANDSVFILLTDNYIPPKTPIAPVKGYIDVAAVKNLVDTTNQHVIAQESKSSPLAKTVEHPTTPSKGRAIQIGVDGLRGKCQVFDVAMATSRESKTASAQVEKEAITRSYVVETKLERSQLPNALAGIINYLLNLSESQTPIKLTNTVTPNASDMPEQITDNLPTELPVVDVGDSTQGLPQIHAFANPQTIDKLNIPASLVHSAKPLDINRQAVFAAIGKDSESPDSHPTYLTEKTKANAFSLTAVAIAGQFLAQQWRHTLSPCQTQLLPPRRRGASKIIQ
jgi:hypothetical protein